MKNAPLAILLVTTLLLLGCEQSSMLERIQSKGELIVATRNAPTTYFLGPHGLAGLEYDLVTMFAQEIGVQPRFVTARPLQHMLSDLSRGQTHMAAAGLTVTEQRARALRFSRPYQQVTQQVVFHQAGKRPIDPAGLQDGHLEVVAGSSHAEALSRIRTSDNLELTWLASEHHSSQEMIARVDRKEIDYTIADSNELTLMRRYYAHVRSAFDISEAQDIAWAFPVQPDDSLLTAANAFFERVQQDGTLNTLLERYFGGSDNLNFVDKRSFWRHVAKRLPLYQAQFKAAARQFNTDWRLLAAVGYQESHWDPEAVSPTGVRGIMMLTRATAAQLGLNNRRDPAQSIIGGARYLHLLDKKIPARIQHPDRLWMTLAGYNIGFGHLEDARILTQRQGGNPDLWQDVKARLPLLRQKKYYKTLKRGFARGNEAVTYVENIRSFYDMLIHRNMDLQPTIKSAAVDETRQRG